jgi:hypothetical protein
MPEVPAPPSPVVAETLPTVLWIPQLVAIQGLFPSMGPALPFTRWA